jgi:hypothetical protein
MTLTHTRKRTAQTRGCRQHRLALFATRQMNTRHRDAVVKGVIVRGNAFLSREQRNSEIERTYLGGMRSDARAQATFCQNRANIDRKSR